MAYLGIIVFIFGLDFGLKKYYDKELEFGEKQELFDGKIILNKLYNKGAAMSLLKGQISLLKGLTGFFIISLGVMLRKEIRSQGFIWNKIGLACMIGGALSNLHDRMSKSYVIDYFSFNIKKIRNIVFNISDIFILIGSFMIISARFFEKN